MLICILLCCPVRGQDVILHLRNGDRISGRLVTESTNEVVLATAFAEKVSIPASLIQKREKAPVKRPDPGVAPASGVVSELVLTNKPSMAQTAGGAAKPTPPAVSPPSAKPQEPAKTAEVKPEPAAKPVEAAKAVEAAKPPEPSAFTKFLKDWNGEAQFGANAAFSTKERQSFTALIKLTHNHSFAQDRALRNILQYNAAYGRTDGVLSDNRMDGTWKVDYDLRKGFLVYNAFRAGYDEIRRLDFEYDFGPGLGYKWLVRTNFVFKNELGGDYQEQFFADKDKVSRYSLRVAEDMWWQITPKIRWDEKVEFFPAVDDFGDYRIRLESNLSYLLKQNLTLSVNVVDLYDTSVPPGVSKNDLQIRSLLGIKF